MVFIAGEHEDAYDPDFHVYNDVVVEHPDGRFEVYGYPEEVFPPTDFHTATSVGNSIIIIGALSYPGDRVPGVTPIYRLCLETYRIEPIATHGVGPGWLSSHRAKLTPEGDAIVLQGGQVWEVGEDGDEGELVASHEEWRFDLATAEWTRLSEPRPWRLFEIDTEIEFDLDLLPPFPESPEEAKSWATEAVASIAGSPDKFGASILALGELLPQKVEFEEVENPDAPPPPEDDENPSECEDDPPRRIIVEGVPIDLEGGAFGFRILVRGELPEPTLRALIADLQEGAAKILGEQREVQELRVRA